MNKMVNFLKSLFKKSVLSKSVNPYTFDKTFCFRTNPIKVKHENQIVSISLSDKHYDIIIQKKNKKKSYHVYDIGNVNDVYGSINSNQFVDQINKAFKLCAILGGIITYKNDMVESSSNNDQQNTWIKTYVGGTFQFNLDQKNPHIFKITYFKSAFRWLRLCTTHVLFHEIGPAYLYLICKFGWYELNQQTGFNSNEILADVFGYIFNRPYCNYRCGINHITNGLLRAESNGWCCNKKVIKQQVYALCESLQYYPEIWDLVPDRSNLMKDVNYVLKELEIN